MLRSQTSDNGVTGHKNADGDYELVIPGPLLDSLQRAWQSEDIGGRSTVEAVRDLFDGEDGALQYLAALGVPTIPV